MTRVETEPGDELLAAPQAAALLGISESTLNYHLQCGHLPSTRVGRRHRIRRSDVEAWKAVRDRWISIPKAAALLGCSYRRILQAVRDGHLVKRETPARSLLPCIGIDSLDTLTAGAGCRA